MHSRYMGTTICPPLHCGCAGKASFEVIKVLVETYPDALKIVDTNGDLPLHHACWNDASLDVMGILIEVYPHALKIFGQNQSLPLHWMCL